MRQRLQEPSVQAIWRRRGEIIEPRFGQIKQQDGFRRWTVWGLENVRTQWALLCATLNLRVLFRRWQMQRSPSAGAAVLSLTGLRALSRRFSILPLNPPAIPLA
jgi:hypothetical protein